MFSKLDINRDMFDINDGIISFTKRRCRIPDPNRGARCAMPYVRDLGGMCLH
jgi:hypothetical protein